MCTSTHNRTLFTHVHLELWVKGKTKEAKHYKTRRFLSELAQVQPPLSGASRSHSTIPSRTVPRAILHTDPRSFTSHTKHPVSANQAEVLVGSANECVWCQRAVLRPGSPSVWRIHEDESQMRLKVLGRTASPLVLWGEKEKEKK